MKPFLSAAAGALATAFCVAAAASPLIDKIKARRPLVAVMLSRNDPEAKKVLDDEMRRLILSGEIYRLYDKWFLQPIPSVTAPINMPTSFLLRAFWRFPTDFVPD
jgi:glutamate/aspartate transport system substrate-binding protein